MCIPIITIPDSKVNTNASQFFLSFFFQRLHRSPFFRVNVGIGSKRIAMLEANAPYILSKIACKDKVYSSV